MQKPPEKGKTNGPVLLRELLRRMGLLAQAKRDETDTGREKGA